MILKNSKKNLSLILFSLEILLLSSCSLNYNSESSLSSQSPEFVFTNPKYTRINQGKLNLEITADTIEQYATEDAMYAKNINFILYSESEEKSAEGKGTLLSADLEKGLYYLFDDIKVKSFEQNVSINASSLRWDDDSEQLTTDFQNPAKSKVYIISENEPKIKIEGYGFSGSGYDNSYVFTGEVSGEITTKD